jgi:hypothetical protein
MKVAKASLPFRSLFFAGSWIMLPLLEHLNRRQFALGTFAAAAAAALPQSVLAATEPKRRYKYCAFTKFLGAYDYERLASEIAAAGFDGIEVTARKTDSYLHPDRAASPSTASRSPS